MTDAGRTRGPWLAPGQLDDEQRAVYDRILGGSRAQASPFPLVDQDGRLEGPFNAMLLAPQVGMALQELGTAIRYRTSLTDREREIAILLVARQELSAFEWYAHERVAQRCGLTEPELGALRDGEPAASFTQKEACVRFVTQALLVQGDLRDADYQRTQMLGVQALAELVTLVGYYRTLALSLRVWRVPLPQGSGPPNGGFCTAKTPIWGTGAGGGGVF